MTDYIDRQAAIDAICKHGTELERRGITVLAAVNHKQVTVDLLENLPSAEVEPVKHGRWEHEIRNTIDSLHTYQQFRCSVCGMTYITKTPYCPNCGALMDIEEEVN